MTRRQCEAEFGVPRDTTKRDFKLLIKHGLARREGGGRSTRYVLETEA